MNEDKSESESREWRENVVFSWFHYSNFIIDFSFPFFFLLSLFIYCFCFTWITSNCNVKISQKEKRKRINVMFPTFRCTLLCPVSKWEELKSAAKNKGRNENNTKNKAAKNKMKILRRNISKQTESHHLEEANDFEVIPNELSTGRWDLSMFFFFFFFEVADIMRIGTRTKTHNNSCPE